MLVVKEMNLNRKEEKSFTQASMMEGKKMKAHRTLKAILSTKCV